MTTGELITKVQHDYRDHALVNDGKTVAEAQLQGRLGDLKPSCHRSDRTFPVILHYMLSELEAKGVSHIISWQPHGRCFQVHKNKEFVDHILPLWFHQTKFASFQRQLNLYGFNRLTVGRDKNTYYHEAFLRGKRFLSHRIRRIRIKGKGARKPSSPKTEPDFYAMTFLPDTEAVTHGPWEQKGVASIPQAASLSVGAGNTGGILHDNAVRAVPSMPISTSTMHAIAQGHTMPSEATHSFLSNLSIGIAAQRDRLFPATQSNAMLNMHFTMPPPYRAASLLEHNQFARIAGIQSTMAYADRTAPVNQALASVEEYFRHGGRNQYIAALLLDASRMHR